MAYHMFAAVLLLLSTPAVVATTYTDYVGNAYKSAVIGDFGGSTLDHCERANNTLAQCQDWCTQDCECHCFTVYEPNGACFRRHSCDNTQFNSDTNFRTYVKDNFVNNCTNFEDLGFDTQCGGNSLAPLTATNIGSLEQCKALCHFLRFECKGIQYYSNCANTAEDQCLIYTTELGAAIATAPTENLVKHYHCLKYVGEKANLTGGLIVPKKFSVNGIDGSGLSGNQAAADTAGTLIKEVFANMSSHVTVDHVMVQLHPNSPMVADVQIEMQNETAFYEVTKTLQNGEATLLTQLAAVFNHTTFTPFTSGSVNITDIVYNFSQVEFLTSTITETTTTETTTPCTQNCTTTTEQITVSHGAHQIPMLSTMFMWFAARFCHV